MIPVASPFVVSFLQHLCDRKPEISILGNLPVWERLHLISDFMEERGLEAIFKQEGARWVPKKFERFAQSLNFSRTIITGLGGATSVSKEDPLVRYRRIPNRIIFFFTSADTELIHHLQTHWDALSAETGEIVDVYDFTIRNESRRDRQSYQSFSRALFKALSNIPGLSLERIQAAGLPCFFLWSDHTSKVVSLAGVTAADIHQKLRDGLVPLQQGALSEWMKDELDGGAMAMPVKNDLHLWADPCDVFLSYQRNDIHLLRRVRSVIEQHGLQGWHDEQICCGELFRTRIYSQIKAASTTLVLLTQKSINSYWVRQEAKLAMTEGKALPIAFDLSPEKIPDWLEPLNVLFFESEEFRPDSPRVGQLIEQIRRKLALSGS